MKRADERRYASWSYRDWDGASDAERNTYLAWRERAQPVMRDTDYISISQRPAGTKSIFHCECGFACVADFSTWLAMICPACGRMINELRLIYFPEFDRGTMLTRRT
jgi:hypothetical protein